MGHNKGSNNGMFGKCGELSPRWTGGKPKCKSCRKTLSRKDATYCRKCLNNTEEGKAFLHSRQIGRKSGMENKYHSDQTKIKMSISASGENNHNYGKLGEDSLCYKGGKTASHRRNLEKRRGLGFDPVNEPLNIDDEVAHHLTKDYVAYVPEFINKIPHNIHTGKNMDEVNFFVLNYLFLIYNK
jgi:hypothetical protein